MNNIEELETRRAQVIELLKPDELRDHRVSYGHTVSTDQIEELDEIAKIIGVFTSRMDLISKDALNADPKDRLMYRVRLILGTEATFQALQREEVEPATPANPKFSKADLVFTNEGLRIVEIEPGKLRGMGYGVMVRRQNPNSFGIGADQYFERYNPSDSTSIIVSTKDRFHVPEISILERAIDPVFMSLQDDLRLDSSVVTSRGRVVDRVIMMSPLVKGTVSEIALRECVDIISDHREDLESKGTLALVHNAGADEQLEELLECYFSAQELQSLRRFIPLTYNTLLIDKQSLIPMLERAMKEGIGFFGKPISDSGTRGIITPDRHDELINLIKTKHGRKIVIQEAQNCGRIMMESMGILSGDVNTNEMNLRLTVHVSSNGEIIESTITGSPDDYLAHGGTKSVITELEACDA